MTDEMKHAKQVETSTRAWRQGQPKIIL